MKRGFFLLGAAALYLGGIANLVETVSHYGVAAPGNGDVTLALVLVLGMTAVAVWVWREQAAEAREPVRPAARADRPDDEPLAVYPPSRRHRLPIVLAAAAATAILVLFARELAPMPELPAATIVLAVAGAIALLWAVLLLSWRSENRHALHLHAAGLSWVNRGRARFVPWDDVDGMALVGGRLTLWARGEPCDLDRYVYDERLAEALEAHGRRGTVASSRNTPGLSSTSTGSDSSRRSLRS